MVNSALDDYFSDSSVKIISEPGRFFCSTAFTLACKIHSIRSFEEKSDEHSSQIKYMYYINDGVYNNFNYVITEHKQFHPRFLKVRTKVFCSINIKDESLENGNDRDGIHSYLKVHCRNHMFTFMYSCQ